MPTFDTPEPVPVELDLVVADVTITATDRTDTVIEVRPSEPGRELDEKVAAETRVELVAGRLLVRTPKQRWWNGMFTFKYGSIDVSVEVPTGTPVRGESAVGGYHATGLLGECRFRSATGDVRLDRTGALDLNTSAGAVAVGHVAGRAEIGTGSGKLRVDRVDGPAVVKNSNGDCRIGEAGDDLRVNTANGEITVDRAAAGVTARTANGDIRVGELARGTTSLKTAFGVIEVAVRRGTAVRLDLYTQFGKVNNDLDVTDGPAGEGETAEVTARTSYGDITIRRATTPE
jgi:DUF4097 and DUF4098 domain-containing protein YvlB